MSLKEIFVKPINRPIEGVIKADDDQSLRLELDEYVVTNEIEGRLDVFLDAYNNYENANGVWISGFFGSGKSHLLKMLSLVLANRMIEGDRALDIFLSHSTIRNNEILTADLKKAASIPSQSILFNIDQKADVISKDQTDALLAVFSKVFDEACGYYGKKAYIADFERDLDEEDLLEKFKLEVQQAAGQGWEGHIRQRSKRYYSEVDAAYNKVTKQLSPVSGILDKYRRDYSLSIEDFANRINDYINTKESGFRLNFFVDEVGQYIADNVKLMTNLQTIAESLATKCKGQSWVVVTAQEDMSSVVGEMTQQQGNDFSKIQARFSNRMKLTSQDVAEVIQKRLLLKNDKGIDKLTGLYHQQQNNFKTLFDFADGAKAYRNFIDKEHFIHSYPFIPYQFDLFQSSIQGLSAHNAFEGKHSSVGERSMLGVFQQVAVNISDHKIGQLATFDCMFEGVRTALKTQIQAAILQAENNLDNPFAIRVLKSLFLVKYVKEFRSTIRNLCVLMLDDFDQDIKLLRKNIEEALNILEQQTYIQRNGDQYDYLTDEEKDIEEEIKSTEVENADVADELQKYIFDHIIKDTKINFPDNKQDYKYTRKIDDNSHGREHELSINVITPFHEDSGNHNAFKMRSMGLAELFVIMPSDDKLLRNIMHYKKTEKYIRQNNSHTQQDAVARILSEKGNQNIELKAEVVIQVKELLVRSALVHNGDTIDITSEDPKSKIIKGFYQLIKKTYINLKMLPERTFRESDIPQFLDQSQEGLFGNDATVLSEAEQEVFSFIQTNHATGIKSTLKSVEEHFEKVPYGWYHAGIICISAMLCARGKIEVTRDSNILEDRDLKEALTNTRNYSQIILQPQADFSPLEVRKLKEFYEDFFDQPPQSIDAKNLGNETGESFTKIVNDLNLLLAQSSDFPFLNSLRPVIQNHLKQVLDKPYAWYLKELLRDEEDLLDAKEDLIDPIQKFMDGNQKQIYLDARKFVIDNQANISYIDNNSFSEIETVLDDPKCFKGDTVRGMKVLMGDLKKEIDIKIKAKAKKAKQSVLNLENRLQNTQGYESITQEQKGELSTPFKALTDEIDSASLIAVINDSIRQFEDSNYSNLLTKLAEFIAPKESTPDQSIPAPAPQYISTKNVLVDYDKALLANESDVDQYLENLRKALLKELKDGKQIQV